MHEKLKTDLQKLQTYNLTPFKNQFRIESGISDINLMVNYLFE
jgi:hypothetical protein